MFVRWSHCHVRHLCSRNGGSLRFATNYFFLSVVIELFKLMGVLMMILRKTENIWRILIRICVVNS